MALAVKVSDAWKYVSQVHTKVSGSWKAVRHIYTKVNGAWKPLYSYSWRTGNWSNCSVSCGGGTQTRQAVCIRNHPGQTGHVGDWKDVADTFCTSSGLAKPATSQSCNTHTCAVCRYDFVCDQPTPMCLNGTGLNYVISYQFCINATCADVMYDYYWDNKVVILESSTADGIIANGYRYERGELKDSGTKVDMVGEGTFHGYYYNYYAVCRTPV